MLGTYGPLRHDVPVPTSPRWWPSRGRTPQRLLEAAIANLPADVYVPPAVAGTDRLVDQTVVALKDPQVQEGGYYVEGRQALPAAADVAGEARAREITPSTPVDRKTTLGIAATPSWCRLSQMRTLRTAGCRTLRAKTMERLRKLNSQYDTYVRARALNDQGTTRCVRTTIQTSRCWRRLSTTTTPGMGIAAAKRQGIKPYRSTAKKAPIFTARCPDPRTGAPC